MNRFVGGLAGRLLAGTAAACLAVAPAVAQSTAVGVNAALRNKVEIRSAGTNQVRPAVLRQQVILNDEVHTAGASWLQILLLDKTTFTVGADARVVIDRFVYDPAANSRSTSISVTRGAFRFMSGRTLGKPTGPATVRTPVATIGIRGTIFDGAVGQQAIDIAEREGSIGTVQANPDEATLVVLRGPGPRTEGDTIPGAIDVAVGDKTITLDAPGLALYIPRAGAAPIGPFHISSPGLQALESLLRPAPTPIAEAARARPHGFGAMLPVLILGVGLAGVAATGSSSGSAGSPPVSAGPAGPSTTAAVPPAPPPAPAPLPGLPAGKPPLPPPPPLGP
jgi:FecR-like protein